MVRSALFGAAAALALTVTATPGAKSLSANDVMQGCRNFAARSRPTDFSQGYCAGIVMATTSMGISVKTALALEGAAYGGRVTPAFRSFLCMDIPDGAIMGQHVRIVIAYIDARPARMHEPFDGLALEALRAAWP